MAPDKGREAEAEASLWSRRQYMLATGAAAIGVGSTSATAAAETSVEPMTVSTDHRWSTKEISTSYSTPVVVAPSLSYNGTNPASPRVRNAGGDSFDVRVQEWEYLDGRHLSETVGCFVTSAGEHASAEGSRFVVGKVESNHRWTGVSFESSFSTRPVVFSNAQTYNGRQAVVTRHRNVSGSAMDVRLQEEEGKGPHLKETIGFLAIEPGTGTIDGRAFEARNGVDVSSNWRTVSFDDTYEQPVFIADLQSYHGTNTATLRYRNLTGSSVEVRVEEERSDDREMAHLAEDVGYLVVENESTTETGYGVGGYGEGGYGE